jgi:transposase InsO family protein
VLFFAFILDAFSRTVARWQLEADRRSTLVLHALKMALGLRGSSADVALAHHYGRGSPIREIRLSRRP